MFSRFFKPKKLSADAFAEEIADRLRKHPKISRVNLIADDFGLDIWDKDTPDGKPRQSFLENAFRHYERHGGSKSEQETILADWVQNFAVLPVDAAVSVGSLYPMVRHVGYVTHTDPNIVDYLNSEDGFPDDYSGPIVQPLCADLVVVLSQDLPGSVITVGAPELEEVGLSVEDAWDAAFANLDKHVDCRIEQLNDEGALVMEHPDAPWLTGSLLLFPGLFEEFMDNNNLESVLISHPCRSSIFFTGGNLDHGLDMMAMITGNFLNEDHPQSNMVFRMTRADLHLDPVTAVDEHGTLIPLD